MKHREASKNGMNGIERVNEGGMCSTFAVYSTTQDTVGTLKKGQTSGNMEINMKYCTVQYHKCVIYTLVRLSLSATATRHRLYY